MGVSTSIALRYRTERKKAGLSEPDMMRLMREVAFARELASEDAASENVGLRLAAQDVLKELGPAAGAGQAPAARAEPRQPVSLTPVQEAQPAPSAPPQAAPAPSAGEDRLSEKEWESWVSVAGDLAGPLGAILAKKARGDSSNRSQVRLAVAEKLGANKDEFLRRTN